MATADVTPQQDPPITAELLYLLSADPAELAEAVAPLRGADIVDALNTMAPEVASRIVAKLPFDLAVEVLDEPNLEHWHEILEGMDPGVASAFVAGMSADRRAEAFREVPTTERAELLTAVDEPERRELQRLLQYEEGTAGGIMTTEFVTVPSTSTVGVALDRTRAAAREKVDVHNIYVVDARTERLLRAISLQDLLLGADTDSVMSVGDERPPLAVPTETDQEEVSRIISRYNLLAVPVVDDYYRIVGIITVDDAIDTIVEETTEDVQKFGGMEALDEPYLRISFRTMLKKRAGWLSALFLSEMLTASAMQHFEGELKAVVLAMFIPLVMSSGGNSGSQATSLIIRALALREVTLRDWWRVALRELPTGLVLGSFLGVIGFIRIQTWQYLWEHGSPVGYNYGPHHTILAVAIATTLVGIVAFGSMVGSMLPFLLRRLGFDPASASAPFVATLVDVTGISIYFTVAYMLLRGTIL